MSGLIRTASAYFSAASRKSRSASSPCFCLAQSERALPQLLKASCLSGLIRNRFRILLCGFSEEPVRFVALLRLASVREGSAPVVEGLVHVRLDPHRFRVLLPQASRKSRSASSPCFCLASVREGIAPVVEGLVHVRLDPTPLPRTSLRLLGSSRSASSPCFAWPQSERAVPQLLKASCMSGLIRTASAYFSYGFSEQPVRFVALLLLGLSPRGQCPSC